MSLNSLGWITGRILSEAGAVDVFELDQDLDATPTRYITLDQEVEAFEIHAVKYLMDPTNAVTYELYLLEAAAAGNKENRSNVVFDSGALRADGQMYIDSDASGKMPVVADLSENPGKLYYVLDWTGAPGTCPGYIKVLGRKVA